MPIHVRVVSQADYASWVDGKKKEMVAAADDPGKEWELAALVARGEKVYNANCAAWRIGSSNALFSPEGPPAMLLTTHW